MSQDNSVTGCRQLYLNMKCQKPLWFIHGCDREGWESSLTSFLKALCKLPRFGPCHSPYAPALLYRACGPAPTARAFLTQQVGLSCLAADILSLKRIKESFPRRLVHQFFNELPYENSFAHISLLLMLRTCKLKKSISLQQVLAKNLLSSFADPPGSTPFPPAHCAIKNWNGNAIVQPSSEASVDGHFISLISGVMANPHIHSHRASTYWTAEKVITLLRE